MGTVLPGARAKRQTCFPNAPLAHGLVNMLSSSACFACIALPDLR
jgi:hypothetical protein